MSAAGAPFRTSRPREIADCVQLALRAAELGKDDALALAKAAHAISAVDGGMVRQWVDLAFPWQTGRGDPRSAACHRSETIRSIGLQDTCGNGLCHAACDQISSRQPGRGGSVVWGF